MYSTFGVGEDVLPSIKLREKIHLQISRLRNYPFINELLRIFGETQKEFAIRFQLVDRFHCFVNFVIQTLNFLLTGR